MLFTKLKLAFAAALVVALGAGGVAFRAGPAPVSAQAPKPPSELEALRKENELLKVNLMVVLEKVRAQEAEIRALKGGKAAVDPKDTAKFRDVDRDVLRGWWERTDRAERDVALALDEALRALKEARDKGSRDKAVEALEKAAKALRQPKTGRGPLDRR